MKITLFPLFALLLACTVTPAHSSIVITGTRVIYPATDKEVSVKMNNNGSGPVLVQSWIDAGDPQSTPETAKAPFILSPPINRVNAGKGQTLRVRYSGDPLPQDKESVFYLNVLEVPPKVQGAESKNMLQMAFRTRLKLFFRPRSLTKEAAAEAPMKVMWSRSGNQITAHNPTPFHINIAFLSSDAKGENGVAEGGMIVPRGSLNLTLDKSVERYFPVIINDYGALRPIDITTK
ncbi:molecular chaperone [Klebsiella oxytoca]|nr:molecular chaperone [Klebsiella oxytoca]